MSRIPETVDILVEIPRGGVVKRRPDGSVDFVSPLPCPFNYGSVPGTTADDGDPLDVVLLGPRRPRGERLRVRVHAVVRFVDDGRDDVKLVCKDGPPAAWEIALVRAFFRAYSFAKCALNRVRGRNGRTASDGVVFRENPPR